MVDTVDLKRRVKLYKDHQRDGYGAIIVQANVEDTRLGVQEYAIEKLGVEIVELKWGQGAKDIGGEVKIRDLAKAQLLAERGYIVLPDPTDPHVIKAFERGAFKEFERHSRVGMVSEEGFAARVEELRKAGAKYVFLKTGAYRPVDLARAVKWSSKYSIDLLTVDGAGGGTGMSPWRMMNEWGVPPVELHSLLYQYCKQLADRGEYVPAIAVGGRLHLRGPDLQGPGDGRARTSSWSAWRARRSPRRWSARRSARRSTRGSSRSTSSASARTKDEIFVTAADLRKELGDDEFEKLPTGAIGLYTYYERLAQGLRQLMAGSRKFSTELITRDDIAALTHEAAELSGITYVMDVDQDACATIMNA